MGHQFRNRNEQTYSGLQIVGSAYVLTWAFGYLWIQWVTRPGTWDYGAHLLAAAPAIDLALAAQHGLAVDGRQLGVPEFGSMLGSGLCDIALTVSAVGCS